MPSSAPTFPVLSVSRMNVLASCSEQYRRKYVEDQFMAPNVTTAAGSAVHLAAEQVEHGIRNAWLSYEDLPALARNAFLATPELTDMRVYGKKDIKWWLDQGLDNSCAQYVRLRVADEEEGRKLVGIEDKVSSEVHGRPVVRNVQDTIFGEIPNRGPRSSIQGFLDQLLQDADGTWVVRDLKNGKPKAFHALQLEVYIWLGRREGLYDVDAKVYGQLVYLGQGDKDLAVEQVTPAMSDGAMIDYISAAKARASDLHKGGLAGFEGLFTDSCGFCDFRSDCPAGRVGQVGR